MLTEQEKLDGVLAAIRSFVPGISTSLKSKSKLHRAIGWVLSKLGNKLYMDLYWTTFGKTVYRPSVCDNGTIINEWKVMLHEGRHADDCYKLGLGLYGFLYLFPQIIGILGVLYALIILPVVLLGGPLALLWGLLSLLCLAPIPALPRALIEARGYIVSLACDFWSDNIGNEEVYIDDLTNRFINRSYYYMYPFKKFVSGYFRDTLKYLKEGSMEMDSYLIMCRTKAMAYK